MGDRLGTLGAVGYQYFFGFGFVHNLSNPYTHSVLYKQRFPNWSFFEKKIINDRIVNASSEEARKIIWILNWCLSHTEIFSKRRKICSWLSERLELKENVEKYFTTNPDCLKCPLNWNWAWTCELCCLEQFLLTKSLPKCYKSLQRTLNCWVETCDLVETISPSQFLVNKKVTPPITDFDYKQLERAVRGRHPHACIKSEILQVKEWWRQGALTTRRIKISKWNVFSCQSLFTIKFCS